MTDQTQRKCQSVLFTAQQLQDAFAEGFYAGQCHGNLPYRYPPIAVAWMESESRSLIGPVRDRPLSREFEKLKAVEREKFNPPIEELP